MIILLIIVALLWLFANKPPAQSSGGPTGTTVISSNPPNWSQGTLNTGPSREPFLLSWLDQIFSSAGHPPNQFTVTATGQAQSSSLEIQNQQLVDFTTVPVAPGAPGGGSSNTGGAAGGGTGSVTQAGGRAGIPLFPPGPQPQPIGPGQGGTVVAPTTQSGIQPRVIGGRIGLVK